MLTMLRNLHWLYKEMGDIFKVKYCIQRPLFNMDTSLISIPTGDARVTQCIRVTNLV